MTVPLKTGNKLLSYRKKEKLHSVAMTPTTGRNPAFGGT